ncbi:hypothetical protein [Chryseobacterium sp. MA9]|uniref:hypothetical protein n=1 Tax=Chryseobacterium sp. MA9 TaxID=2966625 RepID=UPI002105F62C|nr:hypothetical protein [Chryseobacterium sp. MA9]UTX48913.1 hypothetical protein KIK00_01190 [Chryseobacterium sp. MA9]
MNFPHLLGFRTYKLDSGDLCTKGRNFFLVPRVIFLFLLCVIAITVVTSTSEHEIDGNYNRFLILMFFMVLISVGGIIYFCFYALLEREIIFYKNGEIEIKDITLCSIVLPANQKTTCDSVEKISVEIPLQTLNWPVRCNAWFIMKKGDYIKITDLDLVMYGYQGRKLYSALKEFLIENEKKNILSELNVKNVG